MSQPTGPVVMAPRPIILAPTPAQTATVTTVGAGGKPGTLTDFFKPVSSALTQPRLAISLDALEKSGKTHWSLFTTPEPIAVIMADEGTDHVMRKAKAQGRKIAGVLDVLYKDPVTKGKSLANEAMQKEWQAKWQHYVAGVEALAADKTIRTVVRDTETGLWQLCQLAHFGRLTQIPQHLRTECNAAYLRTFRILYARKDLNMVLIHQTKKEYKPNSKGEADWTGKYERDGMNKIGFAVDVALVAGWDGVQKSFYTHVPPGQATRYGPELAGKYWYGEESGFGWLGMELFPETELTPEVWGL
jgi:hypothetical protein